MRHRATSPFARAGTPARPSRRPPWAGTPPAAARDRVRDWLATAPILLLVAMVLVGDPTRAATPTLTVDGMAMAGERFVVAGTGFAAGAEYQLRWDGDVKGMPRVRAWGDGTLGTAVRVPRDAAAGPHVLDAIVRLGNGRRAAISAPVASVTVMVMTHEPEPTSAPTPIPAVPTAVATPTTIPTPAEHEHPTPTPSLVAPAPPSTVPPAAPTVAPTPSPSHDHGGMPDPVACTGYPEHRVFLESQGWWVQTPGQSGTDFGHVHVGMCFPQAQRVSGTVTLDVRLTMHHNAGTLARLYGGIETDTGGHDLWNVPVGLTCPHDTCVRWVQLQVDTPRVPVDGRVEWRFRPQVKTTDGLNFTPSTGWQTYLANGGGRPSVDYRSRDEAIARGWYDGAGYANASIMSVPLAPLAGTWSSNVILDRGSDGIPITSHGIYIDPDFHHGDEGIVVREGSGPYRGTVTINAASLSPGAHRLVLRADARDPRGSTNSGLLVIVFYVAQ